MNTQIHIKREWRIVSRKYHILLKSALFFLMLSVILPLTLPHAYLSYVAPGICMIAILFSLLSYTPLLFQEDFQSGIIEAWLAHDIPLYPIIQAKIFFHWIGYLIPMCVCMPIFLCLFHISYHYAITMVITLIITSLPIAYIAGLGAIFSIYPQSPHMLVTIITLPLIIPIVLFGGHILVTAQAQMSIAGVIAMILAIDILTVVSIPFAIIGIMRAELL